MPLADTNCVHACKQTHRHTHTHIYRMQEHRARWTDLIIQAERLNLTEEQAPKRKHEKNIKAYLPVLYKHVSSSHSRLPSPTQVRSNSWCQASILQHKHLHVKEILQWSSSFFFHNLFPLHPHMHIVEGGGW